MLLCIVNDSIVTGILVPTSTLCNSIPFFFSAFVIDSFESLATPKRLGTYARHAFGNSCACQPCATIENPTAYAFHTATNGYARQSCAIFK